MQTPFMSSYRQTQKHSHLFTTTPNVRPQLLFSRPNTSAQHSSRRQTALLLRLAFQVLKSPLGKLRVRSAVQHSVFSVAFPAQDICYLCTGAMQGTDQSNFIKRMFLKVLLEIVLTPMRFQFSCDATFFYSKILLMCSQTELYIITKSINIVFQVQRI